METPDRAASGGQPPRPWLPVPGPVDRESFFEAQRRHQRATWRLSALCVLTIVVMGIPLSLVLTPLLYALVLLITNLIDLFLRLPEEFWQAFGSVASLMVRVIGRLLGEDVSLSPVKLLLGLSAMLLPGSAVMVLIWLGLRSVFLRSGTGGMLLSLRAREPRAYDPEEKQLVNVVEEMAIAAGLSPPRVKILDSGVANAAAIGSSADDTTVIVSRGLLDQLDRDETQGVLAHLIGSIGNGDLRIALIIASVFQAFGLLVTLVNTPFGPRSRAALARLVRFAIGPKSALDPDTEATIISAILTRNLDMESGDDLDRFMEEEQEGRSTSRSILGYLLIPLMMTNVAVQMTLWVFISLLLGPMIALMWRSRRYLADATAVQLTRYPDGLARALERLAEIDTLIPGGQWASHVFVIGPGTAQERAQASFMREMRDIRSQGSSQPFMQRVATARATVQRRREESEHSTFENGLGTGTLISFHPSLDRRLKRLRSLGATVSMDGGRPTLSQKIGNALAILLIGPLMLLVAALLLCAAAIVVGLNLLFMGIAMLAIHGVFSLLATVIK